MQEKLEFFRALDARVQEGVADIKAVEKEGFGREDGIG